MRKFLSLFCALAIVFSASAAPVSKKDVLAKKAAKKEICSQKVAKKAPAKAVEFKSFDQKAKAGAVALAPRFAERKAAVKGVKVLKTDVAKVQKAKKETIVLDTWDAVEWEDWCDDPEEGWWQIQAQNDDYYVSLSNVYSDKAAGSYAWADLDSDYCLVVPLDTEEEIYFTGGSCTISVDAEGAVTVAGSFSGEDGNTYNISIEYKEEPIEPGDYDFVATTETHYFYSSGNDVYFTFRDANSNVIKFDIVVADSLEDVELGKTYTLEDMLTNYSYVDYNDVEASFVAASFTKTNVDRTEYYTATATDTYGRIFHLTYSFKASEALNKDTITGAVSVTEEEFWYWIEYTFTAQDEKNAISLSIMPDEDYFGTWEAGDDITGSVLNKATETTSDIYSGEVTIAKTTDGFSITGAVLCLNNTEYTLNLTYTNPTKTRTTELTLGGLEVNVFDGGWQLSGFNEDETTYVTVAAYTEEVSGKYDENDLESSYTYIYTDIVWDEDGYLESGNKFKMLDADLTVTFNEADSTLTITGTFLGQNGEDVPEFTLNLSGKIPAPEVSDLTFEISVNEATGISVLPSNNDPWDYYFASEALFESYGADGIAEAIYGNYGNQYAVTGAQTWAWDDEELLYYCGDGGTFYIVVWGSGERNITTEAASQVFEIEGSSDGCTQYDGTEDFNVNFASYTIDDRYLASYGLLFIEGQNEDGTYISLELWLPENATDLVAGEYAVSVEEQVPQTVTAGELDLTEGNIYGSFAGNLTSQGISIPLWLLIDGKVVVNDDLSIDVDAVNCPGAAIKCHLGVSSEAIDHVDAKAAATKCFVNGALVIEKNGVKYNAQGAVVK